MKTSCSVSQMNTNTNTNTHIQQKFTECMIINHKNTRTTLSNREESGISDITCCLSNKSLGHTLWSLRTCSFHYFLAQQRLLQSCASPLQSACCTRRTALWRLHSFTSALLPERVCHSASTSANESHRLLYHSDLIRTHKTTSNRCNISLLDSAGCLALLNHVCRWVKARTWFFLHTRIPRYSVTTHNNTPSHHSYEISQCPPLCAN